MKNDILRSLAQQAKERLKKGNYCDSEVKANARKSFRLYNGGLQADYKLVLIGHQEDEIFYSKVKNLLSENADVPNPLGTLADQNQFAKMTETQRERYIFMLAEKYRTMKERFEKEQFAETI